MRSQGYQTPKPYLNLCEIYINDPPVKHWETVFLGKSSLSGHWNNISGPKRILAAVIQTFWSALALTLILVIGFQFHRVDDWKAEQPIGFLTLITGIFGATFYHERTTIHEKWQYLAATFNSILQIDPPAGNGSKSGIGKYSIREHMLACLAHDILTMEMWAHRSFRAAFKEALERAIIHSVKGNPVIAYGKLEQIAIYGIDYDVAKDLISDYIDALLPFEDRPEFLVNELNRNDKS